MDQALLDPGWNCTSSGIHYNNVSLTDINIGYNNYESTPRSLLGMASSEPL